MRKLSAFDIVLFDLDGTLCAYWWSDAEVLRLAFESTGVEPSFTTSEQSEEYCHGDYVEQYDDVDVIRELAFGGTHYRASRQSGNWSRRRPSVCSRT